MEQQERDERVTLSDGSGGMETWRLIERLGIDYRGEWRDWDDDAATLDLGNGRVLVFTTDTYTVSPLFFPGGNIGSLAVHGTINDLAVMGADPLGISLGLVIEEGFSLSDLDRIVDTIKRASREARVPVVTGDTKVMEKGKMDGIVINTSGVGVATREELLNKRIEPGDVVLASGSLGDHGVAILAERFEYETSIESDTAPVHELMKNIRTLVKSARDPTRGGLSAVLNEMSRKHGVAIRVRERDIPVKPEVRRVAEMLGIDVYALASEGRAIVFAPPGNAERVLEKMREHNPEAAIIGVVEEGERVTLETSIGERILAPPSGRIVPRIC